ncbi:MAG: type I DNA topoisomerase [Alphaproteobacteria bacterium]
MNVVVVESPAKAKTINKYLGKNYKVIASFGHIRDLPSKDGSVKPDDDFAMTWEIEAKNEKHIKEIVAAIKDADTVILATDPDREGEAIAWHIVEELNKRKKLKDKDIKRVVFNEITKNAVLTAMKNPREIDAALVDAYLARRSLDYLVGFTISPVLWRKLPGCKSAGRVQSVALRLICEREGEIEKFKTQEYWTIDADLTTTSKALLTSRLTYLDGKKLDKFSIPSQAKAEDAVDKIKKSSFRISRIARKQVARYTAPPFTTSTLQQEAARKLYFSASKTMTIAQKLYEGIELSGEVTGLITYMRTDGVQMSVEAINDARKYIDKEFGEKYLPKTPKIYKTKAKNAQEAHEAIRPTDIFRTPKSLEKFLDRDQMRLYELVWNRTVASQMENALFDQLVIDSASQDDLIVMRSTGQVMLFDGFIRLYHEDIDDELEEGEKVLPNVTEGEALSLGKVVPLQHFTQPPPRYSEASLVKKLEELGIGRPSTYASIISVLQTRKYVILDNRRFIPEDRGRIVTAFLENYFNQYVQYNWTAELEDKLDDISDQKLNWKDVLKDFWVDFAKAVSDISPLTITEVLNTLDEVLGDHFFPEKEDGSDPRKCPKCADGRISIKIGKFGAFLGCSNYPDCNFTSQLNIEGEDKDIAENENKVLGTDTATGLDVTLKKGPYGYYIQLGEAEKGSKVKPKRCAIPKEIELADIDLTLAQKLLSLPREIGDHPETGEKISAGIGRFGPYLKIGSKFKSLPKGDSVLDVGLDRAVELLSAKVKEMPAQVIGKHPDDGVEITLNSGRFGLYIKHGKVNAAIPKDMKDKELTLEDAVTILKNKKPSTKTKKTATKKTASKAKTTSKKTKKTKAEE